MRLARENPRWGYLRIVGEARKLGVVVSSTSVRAILRRHGLGPAPRRGGPSWVEFLRAQAAEAHLYRVLSVYLAHYNSARPHRGPDLEVPAPLDTVRGAVGDGACASDGAIERLNVLGGLIHEYRQAA